MAPADVRGMSFALNLNSRRCGAWDARCSVATCLEETMWIDAASHLLYDIMAQQDAMNMGRSISSMEATIAGDDELLFILPIFRAMLYTFLK